MAEWFVSRIGKKKRTMFALHSAVRARFVLSAFERERRGPNEVQCIDH